MKRAILTLFVAAWFAATGRAGAQSTVYLSDLVPDVIVSHIYGPEPSDPTLSLVGNVPTRYSPESPNADFPVGTTVYQGQLLGGSPTGPTNEMDLTNGYLYTAQLWVAPRNNASPDSLQPVPWYTTTLRTGPYTNVAGFIAPLSFTATNPDPGLPPNTGSNATCQLRVWYNAGGAIASWDNAQVLGVLSGASPLFNLEGLASTNFIPPFPANLIGLQSFNIHLPSSPGGAPHVSGQPQSATVPLGGQISFTVQFENALAFQWQHNGASFADSARISGAQSQQLVITNIQAGDAGSYRVLLQNFSGATNSVTATLTVNIAPSLRVAAFSSSSEMFTISFDAASSQYYQIQYKTNLAQPDWLNLGLPISPSAGSISVSDLATNSQRFYRIILSNQ